MTFCFSCFLFFNHWSTRLVFLTRQSWCVQLECINYDEVIALTMMKFVIYQVWNGS